MWLCALASFRSLLFSTSQPHTVFTTHTAAVASRSSAGGAGSSGGNGQGLRCATQVASSWAQSSQEAQKASSMGEGVRKRRVVVK